MTDTSSLATTTVDQTADTYSGATERNPMADVVTYVKE